MPTVMAIIQRTGLDLDPKVKNSAGKQKEDRRLIFEYIHEAIDYLKRDVDWIHQKGDEVLSAFVLPPMQILAGCINFCTLLVSGGHLFDLPFKSIKDILDARALMMSAEKLVSGE